MIETIKLRVYTSVLRKICPALSSVAQLLAFLTSPLFLGLGLIKTSCYSLVSDSFFGINLMVNSLPETYGSNRLSWFLRPAFEHKFARVFFGLILISSLALSGYIGSSVYADFGLNNQVLDRHVNDLSFVLSPKEVVVATEKRFQMPVEELIGASQEFHKYHPGVDLRAPLGSNIIPISHGVVKEVIRSLGGYGQAILIEHPDGYSSLYAHAGKIFVDQGSNVDQKTVVASIGLTGYTTGPHLHLEIYQNGIPVNPKYFIDY